MMNLVTNKFPFALRSHMSMTASAICFNRRAFKGNFRGPIGKSKTNLVLQISEWWYQWKYFAGLHDPFGLAYHQVWNKWHHVSLDCLGKTKGKIHDLIYWITQNASTKTVVHGNSTCCNATATKNNNNKSFIHRGKGVEPSSSLIFSPFSMSNQNSQSLLVVIVAKNCKILLIIHS